MSTLHHEHTIWSPCNLLQERCMCLWNYPPVQVCRAFQTGGETAASNLEKNHRSWWPQSWWRLWAFFLLPRDSVSDQFFSMEIIPTFFLLEQLLLLLLLGCIPELPVSSTRSRSWYCLFIGRKQVAFAAQQTPIEHGVVVQSSEALMNAILEDKRHSSNTFIEMIITFATVWEEIAWEILYGIEPILSRLLLSHIPGSLKITGALDHSLGNLTWFHCFLRNTYSWCKTKKKQTNQIKLWLQMAGL